MIFNQSITKGVKSDEAINSHYKDLLTKYLGTMDSSGKDIQAQPKRNPNPSESYKKSTKSYMMGDSNMLEETDQMDDVYEDEEFGPDDEEKRGSNDRELLAELNKIFTPVLVMQGYEKDIADQANASIAEAGILTERNIISFDDETRMSQLIGVCAKLIAKKKNTRNWQLYQKSAAIKKQSSINIQKEEYDQAKDLAQKYLNMVANSSNSSVARDAANKLLPRIQDIEPE